MSWYKIDKKFKIGNEGRHAHLVVLVVPAVALHVFVAPEMACRIRTLQTIQNHKNLRNT
jgi:hypothetical protein